MSYDCTTTASGQPSAAIAYLNAFTRELWLGGIFHGAVELEHTGKEWSFGYCEQGSGVYDCPAKLNPLYKFRESINLGTTCLGMSQVGIHGRLHCSGWPFENLGYVQCMLWDV